GVRDPRSPHAPPGRSPDARAPRRARLAGRRRHQQPRRRPHQPSAQEDRSRALGAVDPHRVGPRVSPRPAAPMMHLTFKTRLAVWHLVYVTLILGVAAFALSWAMAQLVQNQVDAEIVRVAEQEIAAIEDTPHEPLRIHEAPPGTTRPAFERLDKFLQIATLNGEPVAWSATLGTARLPLSSATRERVGRGMVFETVKDFGAEPIRMVSVLAIIGSARYVVQVAASLGDAHAVVHAARWLFLIVA